MNPQRFAVLAICALLSAFLPACDNSESVQPDTAHPKALQGEWKQVFPENVYRFAGGSLALTFGPDSLLILQKSFTDEANCIQSGDTVLCSQFSWENTYRGTWQADDSLLTVSFGFAGTTANGQTENRTMPDGTYRMSYNLRGPGLMTLMARTGDAPLPNRDSLDLSRE